MLNMKLITIMAILFAHIFAYAQDPQCSQGREFNYTLNRCVITTETIQAQSKARNCENLTGDEFKACFKDNVDKQLNEAQAAGDISKASTPNSKYGIAAIVTITTASVLVEKKEALGECSSTSMWFMLGAGVTSLLGEYMAQDSYKKKVNGLADEYTSRMSENPASDDENEEDEDNTESTISAINDNQRLAFDFQIEQEKARKKAHKSRKSTYNLAKGLYASASIASFYEAFTTGGTSCSTSYTPKKGENGHILYAFSPKIYQQYYYLAKLTQSEFLEIIYRKTTGIIFPEAHAFAIPGLSALTKAVGANDLVKKIAQNPYTRAAIATVLAGYSNSVSKKAKAMETDAQERIDLLTELRDSFDANGGASFGSCTAEERDLESRPACFCYLASGGKNLSRRHKNTCKAIYAKRKKIQAADYAAQKFQAEQGLTGCINKAKKHDPSCKCKTTKDDKGENSCLSISGNLSLGSLASLAGVQPMAQSAVDLVRSKISTAQLDGSGTDRMIAKIDKKKDDLLKNKKYAPTLKKVNKLATKIKKHLDLKVSKGLASGAISPPNSGGLGATPQKISAKSAIKNLKKEVKKNKAQFQKGNNLAGTKNKASMDDYNFNSPKGSTTNIESLSEVMKKNYNFNDINDNSTNNIFKIITNRYHRSGLRRLFDDEGISQADEANKSEINER
jgi:hypothetical protein